MDSQEVNFFLDTIMYGEASAIYRGRCYFFNGPCFSSTKPSPEALLRMEVYRLEDTRPNSNAETIIFTTSQTTANACLQAFLEAKIWDGRTFWEAAPEMEWI